MIKILTENGRILRFVMICQDFDQVFYPILNAVRISQDFDQLSYQTLIQNKLDEDNDNNTVVDN